MVMVIKYIQIISLSANKQADQMATDTDWAATNNIWIQNGRLNFKTSNKEALDLDANRQ